MQIGAVAEAAGMTPKTIRFYEDSGLVTPPPRTAGGYRDFPPETVQRLRFIRDAQGAGLTLAEIRGVLALRDDGRAPCAEVSALIAEHLETVERHLAELHATRAVLQEMATRAMRVDPATCASTDICIILAAEAEKPGG
jgi:DNA-binding transcriptional MerR regulator